MTNVPPAKRTAAALLAAAVLTGCGSDDGPSVQEKLTANARASAAGETSYALPPLSRPPEFGARPDIDSEGTLNDDESTVFRQPEGQGQDIPPRIARIPGLSDGSRAFLAKAVPAEARADPRDRGPSPELVERLATGGDVAGPGGKANGGRAVRIERQSGWFD
ncbi:hypothetical protein CKO28_07585 [Rhodovibrio sodomensis]|uniref:DUF3035 domain-containing protein n=1 Tax=Rhodovibrio sodomensis TaxID=1088 RepID=A0ABS1DEQ7_9PROT|nr:hypothetical protein [Rhodovibrio sodomensis]MBK1667895.1 hypothetical protein [Rhodovibrio sodomensis]